MTLTINNRRKLYEKGSKSFSLYEVQLPDGSTVQKEVVGHGGSVGIAPLKADGTLVLVRQFRVATEQSLLEIPAGTLEPGETPADCARRELQEEAGYAPGRLTALGGFFVAPGNSQEYMHLFLAEVLTPRRLPADVDEFIEVVEMPLPLALDGVNAGDIQDAKTIIAVLQIAQRQARTAWSRQAD